MIRIDKLFTSHHLSSQSKVLSILTFHGLVRFQSRGTETQFISRPVITRHRIKIPKCGKKHLNNKVISEIGMSANEWYHFSWCIDGHYKQESIDVFQSDMYSSTTVLCLIHSFNWPKTTTTVDLLTSHNNMARPVMKIGSYNNRTST